jgi:hypothetical protein
MSSVASTSVGAIGQNAARATMTAAFSAVRDDADNTVPELIADDAWAAPVWREAALDYHKNRGDRVGITPENIARLRRLMDGSVSLDRAWSELSRPSGAAASTVEALMFALRSRGVQALGEPDVLRRLTQLDDTQARDIAIRLQKFNPHIASAWTPEDVQVLITMWNKCDAQDA